MSDTGRAVAHRPEGGGQVSEAGRRFEQTITMVREAMLNPAVDAEKAKMLADLLNNQEDRALRAEFNRDFNAALREMPVITKAGIIVIPGKEGRPARTQGRFARFEDIDRVVRPILSRHNMSIRFEVGDSGGQVTVCPILSHANGHTERGGAMRLPLDDSGAKNRVQGTGSAVTYGKRYTMCALLNIVTEGTDDDGSLGKLAVDMPHERQVTVLEEAEAAAAEGRYLEWFATQGVKDRAWLVGEGHHTRLGGGAALPGPTEIKTGGPAAVDPAAGSAATTQGGHDVSTPEGWTAKYEDDCRNAPDRDALQTITTKGARGLERLKASHPALHGRAVTAGTEAIERLSRGDGDDNGGE